MSDQEYDESALLEESGGENEIETETNEAGGDEENDPVSPFWPLYLSLLTVLPPKLPINV